jgi:hypothetical protein
MTLVIVVIGGVVWTLDRRAVKQYEEL